MLLRLSVAIPTIGAEHPLRQDATNPGELYHYELHPGTEANVDWALVRLVCMTRNSQSSPQYLGRRFFTSQSAYQLESDTPAAIPRRIYE